MTDDVAKTLCYAAAVSHNNHCPMCKENDGACTMWESFRGEARAAIITAYQWHKRERRWPSFVKDGLK